jgi:hypothetical protein
MKRVLLMTAAGLVLAQSAMAGMENCRFALHWKAKFVATKTVATLCDNPGTAAVEPNYSPNYNSTTTIANPLPCTQYTTSGPAPAGATIYVVVAKAGGEGVAAVSFGIHYLNWGTGGINPAFPPNFTYCADGIPFANDGGFGDFPAQNGAVRVTWNTANGCPAATQQVIGNDGAHAVVGSFYVYAYGPEQLQVTGNNNLQGGVPELAVANCAGATTDLYQVWGPVIYLQLMGRVDLGGGTGYNPCFVTSTHETTWGKIKTKYAASE